MKIGHRVKNVQLQTVAHLPGGPVTTSIDSENHRCEMRVEPVGVYCVMKTVLAGGKPGPDAHYLFPYGNIVRVMLEPPKLEDQVEPQPPKAAKGKLPETSGMVF